MQAARDRQKSYADLMCKPMEFQVGDKVMLKVSPWKGVIRFAKRGKLNPRYVGPFKVLGKVGEFAYKLELPEDYVASDDLRDALSVIFGLSELKERSVRIKGAKDSGDFLLWDVIVKIWLYYVLGNSCVVNHSMLVDSVLLILLFNSEARSWSSPSGILTEEANPLIAWLPEDLVPAEDEAPTPPLPPFFLSPRIDPTTRAAMA
ncbi:hypothetical protein Tco_0762914 [Tanacetum coccineum]